MLKRQKLKFKAISLGELQVVKAFPLAASAPDDVPCLGKISKVTHATSPTSTTCTASSSTSRITLRVHAFYYQDASSFAYQG